jgi:uncharacterized protein (TIGR00369 family)
MGGSGDIAQELRERVAASPFHTDFGIRIEAAQEGTVHLRWSATAAHRNLQGTVHGGALATLADVAMGLAVRTTVGPGRRHATIELGVHYVRPATPGELAAVGRVVRAGTQIAFAEADVTDDRGRLVARATATYAVTPREGD